MTDRPGREDIDAPRAAMSRPHETHELNPVFVRGMQRSGTSAMGRAAKTMGFRGFGEGHLWYDLVRPFTRLRDPAYMPNYRDDSYALGGDRVERLGRDLASMLDRFHREALGCGPTERWVDKSPGMEAVEVAPELARLFPGSQFVFLCRNGITTVNSGTLYWSDNPGAFGMMCRGWVRTMRCWREVRGALEGRYLEVSQELMAAEPEKTARRVTGFLGVPEARKRVAELWAGTRVLSAYPDRRPGEYGNRVTWTDRQKEAFEKVCGEEMAVWGYELDFESPGPATSSSSP